MSSSKEIQDFLKKELYSMANQIEGDFSLGEKYDNDYYYNLDSDDRDSCYYENEIGNIIDNIEEQSIELEENIYDYEDLCNANYDLEQCLNDYEKLPDISPETQSLLTEAKKYRILRQYDKVLEICRDFISKQEPHSKEYRYTINIIIAMYSDINDKKAYELSIKFMKKFCCYEDFIKTMYGVLGKTNRRKRWDNIVREFIECLFTCLPHCLARYIEDLGVNNPMRKNILKTIEKLVNKNEEA